MKENTKAHQFASALDYALEENIKLYTHWLLENEDGVDELKSAVTSCILKNCDCYCPTLVKALVDSEFAEN
jgi:hypothetical protein